MRRVLLGGIGFAILMYQQGLSCSGNDAFVAANFAFWAFVIGAVVGWMSSPLPEPWELDNPGCFWSSEDANTSTHAIKSILLEAAHKGFRWRILNIDPCLGTLVAAIDVIEPAAQDEIDASATGDQDGTPDDGGDDRPCDGLPPGRRNIVLFVQIRETDERTVVKLRWRVTGGRSRVFCNDIIAFTTRRIQSIL